MNVTVFDEHIELFPFWVSAKKNKKIEAKILLHVDSHDDMGFPSQTDESLYAIKDLKKFTQRNLTIASFMAPAAILGCFSEIYDLRPANEPNPNKAKVTKAEDEKKKKKRKKKVFRSFYFSWNDEGKIWYKNLLRHGQALANAKRKHELVYRPILSLSKVPTGAKVILDIDMDYFSCNHFVDYQYQPKLSKKQILEAQRFSQSNDAYKMDLGLVAIDKEGRFIEASAYHVNRKQATIYNDDPLWIDFAIRDFVAGIRKRVIPSLVSIARSVKTGYTPAKHADLIEQALLENLKSKAPIDVTPPYKATFIAQKGIFYNPQARHIVNSRNLSDYYFEHNADAVMWQMIQAGACFGDIIERLMKDFRFSRQKAEKELVGNIWYLKKDGVLR